MSIEITRVTTTKILQYIEPHLSFTNPSLKLPFLEEFVQFMTQAPEALMVLAAIESDDEEVPVRAFAIAQNPGFKVPFVRLVQAWSHPDNPWDLTHEMFGRLIMWASSLGKSSIRAETQRSTAALYRKFGFETLSQVVEYDLDVIRENLSKCSMEVLK